MNKRRVLIYGVMVCGLVGASFWLMRRKPGDLEHYASYVTYPFLKIHYVIANSIQSWSVHKKTITDLEKMCTQLQLERDQLLSETIALKTVISYAEDVHELMAFKKRLDCDQAIIAPIIARQFTDQAQEFFIDAGSTQGIEVDMVAIYLQFLVGRVVEVYPMYSKVIAITDKRCKVSAFCADTKAVGIHEGSNEVKKTHLARVSHLNSVKNGDLVISTGEGLVFPRGFGLGRITSCTLEDELVYDISVEPCIDMSRLNYCCIIPKGRICTGPLEQEAEQCKVCEQPSRSP